jgi:hypothetical protein
MNRQMCAAVAAQTEAVAKLNADTNRRLGFPAGPHYRSREYSVINELLKMTEAQHTHTEVYSNQIEKVLERLDGIKSATRRLQAAGRET